MSNPEGSTPAFPFHPSGMTYSGRLEVAARRLMEPSELTDALTLAQGFNQDQSLAKGEYLREQFSEFQQAAAWTPGFEGVFATGYPFYANREDGTVVAIDEIDRFIGEIRSKADQGSKLQIGNWVCGMCQVITEHKDLKERCRPCDVTTIKPRDMFKALPDLDFWVVVEEDSPHVEGALQSLVSRAGFQQSDADIYFAIRDTVEVMSALREGRDPKARLPIDLHVVTTAQLTQALEQLQVAVQSKPVEPIPIAPRSLHIVWEDVDEPYDFVKDFILSFTPGLVTNPELRQLIEETRQVVARHITPKGAIRLTKAAAPKEKRQLNSSPELQDLLVRRIESWKVTDETA